MNIDLSILNEYPYIELSYNKKGYYNLHLLLKTENNILDYNLQLLTELLLDLNSINLKIKYKGYMLYKDLLLLNKSLSYLLVLQEFTECARNEFIFECEFYIYTGNNLEVQ